MQIVIVLIHLFIVLAMIGVVLLQKSEGGGLGIGSTGGFLSSRGTANVLTRTTAALAIFFFATSLILSILAGWDRKPRSIIQNTGAPTQQQTPLGEGGGVLDTLRQQEQQPATPPPGPQVPRSQ
ncbi:MAG TPA: preprotein translocase subunit SecG [Xanthobacteraceae bacterium]|nr:preprotein translocase subunit SecG [Xanthobacteraceae bacterium]